MENTSRNAVERQRAANNNKELYALGEYIIFRGEIVSLHVGTLHKGAIFLNKKGVKGFYELKHLEDLKGLETLFLGDNEIERIENISHRKDLQTLYLWNNRIRKIEGLEGLTNLQSLYLQGNLIEKIEGLETLKNLKTLVLSNNRIRKIEGLDNLENLTSLSLDGNLIENIEGLDNLRNLRYLHLDNNKITEIKNLDHLENLVLLSIENNRIVNLRGLEHLANLTTLMLDGNYIPENLIPPKRSIEWCRDYCRRIKRFSINQIIRKCKVGIPLDEFEKINDITERFADQIIEYLDAQGVSNAIYREFKDEVISKRRISVPGENNKEIYIRL